jgi:hypothetical protein
MQTLRSRLNIPTTTNPICDLQKFKIRSGQAPLRLPNGDKMQIPLPIIPPKEIKEYIIEKCKTNIPITTLRKNLEYNQIPDPQILKQVPGTNKLPDNLLWKGSIQTWTLLQSQETETNKTKRKEKILAIRKCQTSLRKIKKEDWEDMSKLLHIQRSLTF